MGHNDMSKMHRLRDLHVSGGEMVCMCKKSSIELRKPQVYLLFNAVPFISQTM